MKAANLLLAADGAVKLADFGVSALSDATLARAKTVIGTPHWMAPEVIEGAAPYDARADVWSLGITAIELVKGRPPHIELSALLAMYTIVNEEAPSLDASAHDAALATFVVRCLEKSPPSAPPVRSCSTRLRCPQTARASARSPTPPSLPPPPPPPPPTHAATARRRTRRRREESKSGSRRR